MNSPLLPSYIAVGGLARFVGAVAVLVKKGGTARVCHQWSSETMR